MAKKIITLEKKVHNLKSLHNNNYSKLDSVMSNDGSNEIKTHQKEAKECQEHQEHEATKTDENTPKLPKEPSVETVEDIKPSQGAPFKCDICGNKFKKEITLRKHINTKHEEQNCKVCNASFKTMIEVLQHVAKEHSNHIKEISSNKLKENKDNINSIVNKDNSEERDNFDSPSQFKCFHCKEIVSLDDKFNDDLKEDQMCKLCTIFQAYG